MGSASFRTPTPMRVERSTSLEAGFRDEPRSPISLCWTEFKPTGKDNDIMSIPDLNVPLVPRLDSLPSGPSSPFKLKDTLIVHHISSTSSGLYQSTSDGITVYAYNYEYTSTIASK